MPIYLDGKEYADAGSLEAAYNPHIPEDLKRVYIMKADPRSDKQRSDQIEMAGNEMSGDFQSRWGAVETVSSTMPLESTEKLAGALKPNEGTPVASDDFIRPEPSYVNPPEGNSLLKGVGKFIAKTAENVATLPKRAIENSQESLNTGNYDPSVPVEAAMTAITGSLPFSRQSALGSGGGNVNSNYIDMFIKQPELKTQADKNYEAFWGKNKAPEKELDATEKALKAIMEALDGPGAYEAKYGKPAEKITHDWNQVGNGKFEVFNVNTGETLTTVATKQQAEGLAKTYDVTGGPQQGTYKKVVTKKDVSFEQVPYGYTEEQWAKFSPTQKKHIDEIGSQSNYLNDFQIEEFKRLQNDYATNKITYGEYKEEVAEYVKFIDHKKAEVAPKKDWPLSVGETVEIYHGYSEVGNYKAANKIYAEFLRDAKAKDIQKFDEYLYKLEAVAKKTAKDDAVVKAAVQDAADAPVSKWHKVVNTIEELQGKLFNTMLHERAKYHYNRLQETLPDKAKEAGYDTPAFRGLKNRDEIQPIHNFEKTNHMYSSDSPLLADMYADYLSKHPGWNVKEGTFSEGATIAPLVINTKNYHVFDAKGAGWQSANQVAIREARDAGKPGVIVKNVWDEPNSTKSLGQPATVYITFPSGASTVKSRHATKFDASSPNMLHAIPVLAVGGAAGYVSKEVDEKS